jgi:hypothetical protein
VDLEPSQGSRRPAHLVRPFEYLRLSTVTGNTSLIRQYKPRCRILGRRGMREKERGGHLWVLETAAAGLGAFPWGFQGSLWVRLKQFLVYPKTVLAYNKKPRGSCT